MKLEPKQLAFCREYVVDYNGTQAAIRAGYSKKTANEQAARALAKVSIQEEIAKAEHEIQNKIIITKEKILKELALIGFSSIDEHLSIDDGGLVRAKTFEEMTPGAVKAIKKVKEKRVIRQAQDDSEDMILDSTFEFELYDKQTALVNMGKELGMFRDKVDHKLTISLEDIVAGENNES
jgi:phage terminase small subunit